MMRKLALALAGFFASLVLVEHEAEGPRADLFTTLNILGALGLIGVVLWGAREVLRHRPRTCKVCRQKRLKLDEAADDAHLDAGQRQEETLKSIDYDVWYCETCDDVLVIPWRHLFSSHTRCKKCKYRTVVQSSQTLVKATYARGGKVQVILRCGHCSRRETYTRSTRRLKGA